jgi:hypothetical protein
MVERIKECREPNRSGVIFCGGNACFLINKVGKQFANGADDSVLSFYQTIPVLFGSQDLFGDEQNAQ